jgi:hypothetical protein
MPAPADGESVGGICLDSMTALLELLGARHSTSHRSLAGRAHDPSPRVDGDLSTFRQSLVLRAVLAENDAALARSTFSPRRGAGPERADRGGAQARRKVGRAASRPAALRPVDEEREAVSDGCGTDEGQRSLVGHLVEEALAVADDDREDRHPQFVGEVVLEQRVGEVRLA